MSPDILKININISRTESEITGQLSKVKFQQNADWTVDRYGFKYFVVAGPLFSLIFLSIIGVIPKLWLVLLILFFGNLAIAAFNPSSVSIAGYHRGNRKGLRTSLINFGGIFGGVIGAFLIIVIYEKTGIILTLFLMIFGFITAILIVGFLPDKKNKLHKKNKYKYFIYKSYRMKMIKY